MQDKKRFICLEYSEQIQVYYHAPAVNSDWSVLTKLLLGFVHLADEVDESLAGLRDSLFRPFSELELTHSP